MYGEPTFTLKEILDVIWTTMDKIPYYGRFLSSSDARNKVTDFFSKQLLDHKDMYV